VSFLSFYVFRDLDKIGWVKLCPPTIVITNIMIKRRLRVVKSKTFGETEIEYKYNDKHHYQGFEMRFLSYINVIVTEHRSNS
jgi:hypothetical protein